MRASFGDFVLDRASRELLRGGERLHLEPKAFDLLDLLIRRRPEAISKREIRDGLWPKTFVSESNLTGLAAQIRHALGDDPRKPRFLRTVHGFGYAFSGEVTEEAAARTPSRPAPAGHAAARIIWGERILPLEAGENVLGRDEDADVRIEAPGVSRRHARIVIRDGGATLEDLGSKNGTYLLGRRLDAPSGLADGDTLGLGRLRLVFRTAPAVSLTLTESGGLAPGPRS